MSGFLKVKTAEEVLAILRDLKPVAQQRVDLESACGRVLASPIEAPEPVPHFDRSVMDGYAVRAGDTFGASESLPALLEVAGEIKMGETSLQVLPPGKAIAIPTGGMLPEGANAVVMVEYTSVLDERTIEVNRPVAPGDNVLKRGEDIQDGERFFPAGRTLRPQDVGVLAALGITNVSVYGRPRVAVLSTGDEVLPVSTRTLPPGKIRDINNYTLAGQVEEAGGIVGLRSIVRDTLESLVEACRAALELHDVLILSGGSSVGTRDLTVRILDHLPGAELLVHGVAVRPGKPTILGRVGDKLFWGLPGQPTSALMISRAFVVPSICYLQGFKGKEAESHAGNTRAAMLARQLPSVHGRTDYVPVALSESEDSLVATPIFAKSAMISSLAKAQGYIIVPEHVEGFDRGIPVTVHLF